MIAGTMRTMRMMTRCSAVAAVALGLGALLGACKIEGTGTKMQWAPDMADNPTSKPQKSYLDPPDGAQSMGALPYPKTVEESEQSVAMPPQLVEDAQGVYLAQGKVLYETFCKVCHGPDAKGGGTLGPAFPTPPDLTHQAYVGRKDGFFFYRITFGSAIMPAYGHAISATERWMIIKFLRTLQK